VQYHPLFPPLTRTSRSSFPTGRRLTPARTTEEPEYFALPDLHDPSDLPDPPDRLIARS